MGALALFITLGGVSYAATGGNFVLGQANTASSPTSLSAPVAGKTLQLTNTSTGTGATALGLTVASGKAPFSVNSTGKVTNLNADKLDGLDSTGLVQGRGSLLSNRIVVSTAGGPANHTVLTLPGLGAIVAQCFSNGFNMGWQNNTGGNVDFWHESGPGWVAGIQQTNSTSYFVNRDQPGATMSVGWGNDPNLRRVATVTLVGYQSGDNAPCGLQAQATVWTSQ
jgi:hypothetical protein